MDQRDSPSADLGFCVGSGAPAVEIATIQKTPVVLNNGRLVVSSAEFASFPAPVSHLVGDYVSDSDREYVETAFAGVQPITLCLSQDVGSKLAPCLSIGYLPPTRPWEQSDIMIDKEYLIQDYEGCLRLLKQEDSDYCRIAIEVLVVKLSKTSRDLPLALKDLRKTMEKLENHLSSVKHVVISIQEYGSCCFTLNDAIGKANEAGQSVDNLKAIIKIIKDLKSCWSIRNRLAVHLLFAFYFKNEAKPVSEKYLSKFVIPFNTVLNRGLFKDEAFKMLSTKIMWVCHLKSLDDFIHFHPDTTSLCHAFHLDLSKVSHIAEERRHSRERDPLCFQNNRFIERIMITSYYYGWTIQLPQPSAPLTVATPRSALVELTLKDEQYILPLTQLNSGYFPHLVHLCIFGTKMTGHLDSHRVPSLKTLTIEIGLVINRNNPKLKIQQVVRTQAIVDTGRPWQFVASQDQTGWSMASYDDPTTNPQDDGKENSPPLIRELLLVMMSHQDADEFQSRLNLDSSPIAAVDDQKNGLLEWLPERVEKITVFGKYRRDFKLKFKETMPGQTRMLTFLECNDVHVEISGDALPNLQSLVLDGGSVKLFGSFPQLKTLSFEWTTFESPWQVDAPCLESLDCDKLKQSSHLSLRPEVLPLLSYLRIALDDGYYASFPTILVDANSAGLSHINHVVFGKGMTDSRSFDQYQVHKVSHLELEVNPLHLPKCWFFKEWQCETLTIKISVSDPNRLHRMGITDVKLSLLLPKVTKLTVMEGNCHVLLDATMPKLTELTVMKPRMLGPNLKCPKLKSIRFTEVFAGDKDKEKCSDRATYNAIDAHPEWVYFNDGDVTRMSWEFAPSAVGESSDEKKSLAVD